MNFIHPLRETIVSHGVQSDSTKSLMDALVSPDLLSLSRSNDISGLMVHRHNLRIATLREYGRLDDSIDSVMEVLETLKKSKDELSHRASLLFSLDAPIRTLPPEILQLILLQYNSMIPPTTSYSFPREPAIIMPGSAESILKLTHICQYWRNTAISCPQLWASIFVDQPFHIDMESVGVSDFLSTCLDRSRAAPLHIGLEDWDVSQNDLGEDGSLVKSSLLDMLCSQSHRLHRLSLEFEYTLYQALPTLRGHLPVLESLLLYVRPEDNQDMFEIAPKLRYLTLVYDALDDAVSLPPLKLPWTQITHLRCRLLDMEMCYDALTLTPHLEDLTVRSTASADLDDEEFAWRYSNTSVTLTELKSLTFSMSSDCEGHALLSFLRCVVAPSMESLIICTPLVQYSPHWYQYGTVWVLFFRWPMDVFSSFISTAMNHPSISPRFLTSLRMDYLFPSVTTEIMIALLALLPHLEELDLAEQPTAAIKQCEEGLRDTFFRVDVEEDRRYDTVFTRSWVDAMHLEPAQNTASSSLPLIPKLQHLKLQIRSEGFEEAAFVEFVLDRVRLQPDLTRAHLQSVELRVPHGPLAPDFYNTLRN